MMNTKVFWLLVAVVACSEKDTNPIGSRPTAMTSDVGASLSRINAMAPQDVEGLGSQALLELIVSVAGPGEREAVRARVRDAVVGGGQLRAINGSARYSRVLSRYQTLTRLAHAGRPARPILVAIPKTKGPKRGTADLIAGARDDQDVLVIAASCTAEQLFRAIMMSWDRPADPSTLRSVFPNLDEGPPPRADELAHFAELVSALAHAPVVDVPGVGEARTLRIGGN